MDPGRLPYVDIIRATHGAQLAVMNEENSRRSRQVSNGIDLPRLTSVAATPSLDAVLGQHFHPDRGEQKKARCICINPRTNLCSSLAQR